MKKYFMIASFLFSCTINAQVKDQFSSFSEIEFGAYGGINFNKISEPGGNFLFELKTGLSPSIILRLSFGYFKSYVPTFYNVKTYTKFDFDTTTRYQATTYNVLKKGYDVFPILFGVQYVFKNQSISPYLLFDLSYSFIETKTYRSPSHNWVYDSFDKLPDEYKIKHIESSPRTSYGITFGIGTLFQISNDIELDFRYSYKYDKDLVNTHQFIVGIVL